MWKTPTTAESIVEEKLKYIHQNPVKAHLCSSEIDYRFSSARFYEESGDEFEILADYRR